MDKLKAIISVLRNGSSLTDPSIWKVRQNATNAIVGLLGGILALLSILGFSIQISNEEILAIAGGIAAIGGLFNVYFTTATTTKIGLPSKDKDAAPGEGHNFGLQDK